jgi:hypothetical protein
LNLFPGCQWRPVECGHAIHIIRPGGGRLRNSRVRIAVRPHPARLGSARLHLGVPLIEAILTRYARCEFFSS